MKFSSTSVGLWAVILVLFMGWMTYVNHVLNQPRNCPTCPEPAVVKEIEYVHTETVIQPRCEPCIEIRAEEDFIWVYKAGVPVAYFQRKFLLNQ